MKPTEENLKYLFHQSNLIEGFDDPEFDEQQMVAWKRLVKLDLNELTRSQICKTQKIVTLRQTNMRPDWRGYYRKVDVRVGGRICPNHEAITRLMKNWLVTYTFTHPKTAHVEFEKIHPFVDGNGRTGRLIMWWMQLKRGEDLTEITFANRYDYYGWFR